MKNIMLVLTVIFIAAGVPVSTQDDYGDPDNAPTRYLLVEEYVSAPAAKIELLKRSGVVANSLSVVNRQGRPAYDIDIQMNKGNGSYYKPNDPFSILFVPAKDCYLLIYDIQPDGAINILFPNSASDPLGKVEAKIKYTFPAASHAAIGVSEPFGIEFIQVIATQTPLDFNNLNISQTDHSLFRYQISSDPFLMVNALRKTLKLRSTSSWASKEIFFIAHPRLSDPTSEQWKQYKATGRGIVFDDVPQERRNFRTHDIIWGDTLSAISLRYYGRAGLYPKIAKDNGIVNPHRIYAGDSVKIFLSGN